MTDSRGLASERSVLTKNDGMGQRRDGRNKEDESGEQGKECRLGRQGRSDRQGRRDRQGRQDRHKTKERSVRLIYMATIFCNM